MLHRDVTIGAIVNESQRELKDAMQKVFGARVQFEQSTRDASLSYVVVPEIRHKQTQLKMESFVSGFGVARHPELAGAGNWRRS